MFHALVQSIKFSPQSIEHHSGLLVHNIGYPIKTWRHQDTKLELSFRLDFIRLDLRLNLRVKCKVFKANFLNFCP
jgi:hypothetical protein